MKNSPHSSNACMAAASASLLHLSHCSDHGLYTLISLSYLLENLRVSIKSLNYKLSLTDNSEI